MTWEPDMQADALRAKVVGAHASTLLETPPEAANDAEGRRSRSEGAVKRHWLRRVLREPLTHFVTVGALIFIVSHASAENASRYNITIGPEQLQRIALTYAQQYGVEPSRDEMKAITQGFLREEILRREGMAIGLDTDDEIVRRRIAQKFEFLLQDRVSPPSPTTTDLQSWYAAHRAAYIDPARRSFDQLYFAADARGDAAAQRLAVAALTDLRAGRRPPADDAFPGPSQIRLLSQADTDRLFGGDGFAAQVFAAPPGAWSGPYRSGFGWHLVRVSETRPAEQRLYDMVADRVAADWTVAQRQLANDRAFGEIRARYNVSEPDWLK
jgi:peptidyl-prolyl cis-trans isomerase C